jgi:hypothetical protein
MVKVSNLNLKSNLQPTSLLKSSSPKLPNQNCTDCGLYFGEAEEEYARVTRQRCNEDQERITCQYGCTTKQGEELHDKCFITHSQLELTQGLQDDMYQHASADK